MPLWILVVAYLVVLLGYVVWLVGHALRRHQPPPVRDPRTLLDLSVRTGARATALHHLPHHVARVGRHVNPTRPPARRPPPE